MLLTLLNAYEDGVEKGFVEKEVHIKLFDSNSIIHYWPPLNLVSSI